MKRFLVLAFFLPLAGCDGFKEAMTAHVDVAARAGSQELSVTRLGELLGNAKVPLRRDVVQTVADLWVSYQLLGRAAAHGDSLSSPELVDDAMWSAMTNAKLKKLVDQVSKSWANTDTTRFAADYEKGEMLSAQHILVNVPPDKATTGSDSLARKAEQIRATVTSANFSAMADKHNQPGAAQAGGGLGVFPRGAMVKEFEEALVKLKPGEISPVVRTQFGYHIIRRSTFDEVKDQFATAQGQRNHAVAESTYRAKLEQSGKIQVKPNASALLKTYATNPREHSQDRSVLATSVAGDFTVAKAARWINGMPEGARLRQQIPQVPDSILTTFVRGLTTQELLVRQADSAKIRPDSTEVAEIRRAFVALVGNTWAGLRITPRMLEDSAKTVAEKERLAAARVDAYLERLLKDQEQFIQIPQPLDDALREKYDSKVNAAGIDRALERATQIRATADSTRAAQQPPTAVPMPGQQPPTQQPGTRPTTPPSSPPPTPTRRP